MPRDSVRDLGDEELLSELATHRQKLFDLRFKLATGALEDWTRLGQEKKQIARILTELREREIAAAELAGAGADTEASR
jgi:large subunit ribosomal protein L29